MFQNNYVDHHLVAHDPFVSLDLGGVGSTMQAAVHRIRHDLGTQYKVYC